MSEQDTGVASQASSSHLLSSPTFLHRELPLGHGSSSTNQPNNPTSPRSTPPLSRLNPRQAPQNRRVDPDPTAGHPSFHYRAHCCAGAAQVNTPTRDQPQTSLEGTSISYGARVLVANTAPARHLHVDAERPPVPDNTSKRYANWIGPLVTRSTQGCRRLLPFGFSDLRKQDPGSPALCSARFETC